MRNLLRILGLTSMIVLLAIQPVVVESINLGGPYIDELSFTVVTQDDQMVQALQTSSVDIIGCDIDPTFYDTLLADNDISITHSMKNGYGFLCINTAKYPFNITAFRRAFAFALDKNQIAERVWDNFAEPLDSPVPKNNPLSCEGKLLDSYYEQDLQHADYLLDQAGFFDVDNDGFREAPNGIPFNVTIECPQSGGISIEVAPIAAQALLDIDINAHYEPTDFYDYLNRLYFHGDYDVVFIGKSFNDFAVDWLAKDYCSDSADRSYLNFPNFRNDLFDSWIEQLLHGTSFEEVYEAAFKMQEIFVYESPIIVCYQNKILHAHRVDIFDGHVNDALDGTPSWWTNQEVFSKSLGKPQRGGTFRWVSPLYPDTFNILTSRSAYAKDILCELYDPLLRMDAEGNPIEWIADSYMIQTTDDDPDVPENHTRISFNIRRDIRWSDGTILNASDIAYTFDLLRETGYLLTPEFRDDLSSIQAKTDFQFVIEFTDESYWYLSDIAKVPILPKAQWSTVNVSKYHPEYDELVTSGPFFISDVRSNGEYVELTRNRNYTIFKPESAAPAISTAIAPPDTAFFSIVITSSSITIAIVLGLVIVRYRRNEDGWDWF
ncbi:MAG: ABC transporter substrate-binding protein [Candidatus Thorarchaeota archaeon]